MWSMAEEQDARAGLWENFVYRPNSIRRNAELPEEVAEDVGVFLDDFVDGAAARVAGLRVVEEQDGTVRAGGGLEARGHFSRVQGRDARVAVARDEERGRILGSVDDAVIGRVGVQVRKLAEVLSATVLGNPVWAFQEFLIAQHVQKGVGQNSAVLGPEKRRRPIIGRFTEIESAVAGQENWS